MKCFGKRTANESIYRTDVRRIEIQRHLQHFLLVFFKSDTHPHQFGEKRIVKIMLRSEQVIVAGQKYHHGLTRRYQCCRTLQAVLKLPRIHRLNGNAVFYVFYAETFVCHFSGKTAPYYKKCAKVRTI